MERVTNDATPKAAIGGRRGFTVFELIIVICICALLAAILFPVIARAKESSRRTACSSNLHQIGVALLAYAQDYDGNMPVGIMTYSTASGTTISGPKNLGWGGRIFPYVKSVDTYHCPNDLTEAKADTTGKRAYPVSYAINSNLSYASDLGSLTAPGQTVLLFEVAGDRAHVDMSDENLSNLGPEDSRSAVGDGTNGGLESIGRSAAYAAGAVLYATGEMDNTSPPNGIDVHKGQKPRHEAGANYIAADGHTKYLPPMMVSAGGNANTPTGQQAPFGCFANPRARHSWVCAEGTAGGQHRLTFSVK